MNLHSASVATYIDPLSSVYFADSLFDLSNSLLNLDDSMLPDVQIRNGLLDLGQEVHAADLLPAIESPEFIDYYSLGVLERFQDLSRRPGVRLRGFVIFEPPVVEPRFY
jgi:hypothetical protein